MHRRRLTGHRECGEDPAVGVEHVARDARAHAVDVLAPKVAGGDEQGAYEADLRNMNNQK